MIPLHTANVSANFTSRVTSEATAEEALGPHGPGAYITWRDKRSGQTVLSYVSRLSRNQVHHAYIMREGARFRLRDSLDSQPAFETLEALVASRSYVDRNFRIRAAERPQQPPSRAALCAGVAARAARVAVTTFLAMAALLLGAAALLLAFGHGPMLAESTLRQLDRTTYEGAQQIATDACAALRTASTEVECAHAFEDIQHAAHELAEHAQPVLDAELGPRRVLLAAGLALGLWSVAVLLVALGPADPTQRSEEGLAHDARTGAVVADAPGLVRSFGGWAWTHSSLSRVPGLSPHPVVGVYSLPSLLWLITFLFAISTSLIVSISCFRAGWQLAPAVAPIERLVQSLVHPALLDLEPAQLRNLDAVTMPKFQDWRARASCSAVAPLLANYPDGCRAAARALVQEMRHYPALLFVRVPDPNDLLPAPLGAAVTPLAHVGRSLVEALPWPRLVTNVVRFAHRPVTQHAHGEGEHHHFAHHHALSERVRLDPELDFVVQPAGAAAQSAIVIVGVMLAALVAAWLLRDLFEQALASMGERLLGIPRLRKEEGFVDDAKKDQ